MKDTHTHTTRHFGHGWCVFGPTHNFAFFLHSSLSLSAFTIPVFTDEFKLWIPQPEIGEGTFRNNAKKLLMPFSTNLWLAIIGTILLFAIMSAFISPGQFREEGDEDAKPGRKTSKTFFNSLSASALDFMGGALAYKIEASASQKLLDFGFSIFIFVTVTAYTAK